MEIGEKEFVVTKKSLKTKFTQDLELERKIPWQMKGPNEVKNTEKSINPRRKKRTTNRLFTGNKYEHK
jgi:hypothetical protein